MVIYFNNYLVQIKNCKKTLHVENYKSKKKTEKKTVYEKLKNKLQKKYYTKIPATKIKNSTHKYEKNAYENCNKKSAADCMNIFLIQKKYQPSI